MKTETTYILLERGTEDMELLAELHRITAATGIIGVREFIKKYPRIHELKQGLEADSYETRANAIRVGEARHTDRVAEQQPAPVHAPIR